MSEDKDREGLVLAALLHDIGKFKQRVGYKDDKGKTHVQVGHEWLVSQYGEGIIAAGARNHHGNEPETWQSNLGLILYEADNCAASERETSFDPTSDLGKAWQREIKLASVFSRIRNPDPEGKNELSPSSYNILTCLDKWAEPVAKEKKNEVKDYRKLWEGFEEEFGKLRKLNNHYNIEAMVHLLEKYTSFIPSITLKIYSGTDEITYRKHPDISLFDHLKITAAAAVCLYDYHRHHRANRWNEEIFIEEITGEDTWYNEEVFMLIGGDISGVQKFIYTISSKGALKSLKGRSFFLELLTEHTVDRLLEEMRLSRCNVIFTGGGHFYLLAPNVPDVLQAIQMVRKEMNDYLFDSFNGTIQQFIEAIPFAKNAFKDPSTVWGSLSRKLENAKFRKWEDRVDVLLSDPEMPHSTCLTNNCQVCGREDKPIGPLSDDAPDVLACQPCRDQYRLGALLQRSVRGGGRPVIYRYDSRPKSEDCIQIGNSYYRVSAAGPGKVDVELDHKASAVLHMNDWNLSNFTHPCSRPLMGTVYLPEKESCRDLEGMANSGFGMARLAVLRMDVDHLGRIFSTSIPASERTLSRMASVSRQLSLFFKYHLNGLMERRDGYPTPFMAVNRNQERRLSVVYSGGDDLFLIGHWLDITEAAFDIKNAFERFTGNPYITLSAGVALGDVHDPVYRLAEAAGYAERLAKENARQSVTLFDTHTFRWEEAAAVIRILQELTGLCRTEKDHLQLPDGSISRGVLYRLLAITREHKKEKAWILPKLAYVFGRFQPNEDFAESWVRLKNYIFSNRVNWHHLEVAILWNLMMMRKGGKGL